MSATPRDDIRPLPPAIRLADDERQRAIARLSDAFARDVIAVEEFERRAEAVYRASERSELDLLTQDLPATAPEGSTGAALTKSLGGEERIISSILSSVERTGFIDVPRQLKIRALFGNVELDFRNSRFAPGVTDIVIKATFGNVELRLPPDVMIEHDGVALLGNFELHTSEEVRSPDAQFNAAVTRSAAPKSIVRITGRAILGNVEIWQPRDNE